MTSAERVSRSSSATTWGVAGPAGGHRLVRAGACAVGAVQAVANVDPLNDAEGGRGLALDGETPGDARR